jgi:hypothetical protein
VIHERDAVQDGRRRFSVFGQASFSFRSQSKTLRCISHLQSTSLCRPPHRLAVVQRFACTASFLWLCCSRTATAPCLHPRPAKRTPSLEHLTTVLSPPAASTRAFSQHQHQVGGPPCCIPSPALSPRVSCRNLRPPARSLAAKNGRGPSQQQAPASLAAFSPQPARPLITNRTAPLCTAPHRLERAVNTTAQIPALARRDSTPYHTLIITRDSVSTRHHGLRNEHRGEGGQAAERGD